MLNDFKNDVSIEQLMHILNDVKDKGEPILLTPISEKMSIFCSIINIQNNYLVIKNSIPLIDLNNVLSSKEFIFSTRSYSFSCDKLIPTGVNIFLYPKNIHNIETSRNYERIYFLNNEQARIEIKHPFDNKTIISRQLFDLSTGGLSFRVKNESLFLQPTRILASIKVFINGEFKEEHSGKIIYIRKIVDFKANNYFQVGVQFINNNNIGDFS